MLEKELFDPINNLTDGEIELRLVSAFINSQQYYYKIYLNKSDIEIGRCGIRLKRNFQNEYLGNIEYEINKEYQGYNYAFKASLLLGQVAQHFKVTDLKITTNPTNFPSIKTIQKLGGVFIGVTDVPKDMRLYQTSKEVAVYNWNIKKEGKNI